MFTTNDAERLKPARKGDRRHMFVPFDNDMCNKKEYFDKLCSAMSQPGVQSAFYEHLVEVVAKEPDFEDFDFINYRVGCNEYEDARNCAEARVPLHGGVLDGVAGPDY
jgi:hypothetical protein